MQKIKKIKYELVLFLGIFFAFLSTLFFYNVDAYASSLMHTIKVTQEIRINPEFNDPKDELVYVLEPITEDAPLPQNAKGKYEFILKGSTEKNLNIEYTSSGKYFYKLYQKENNRIEYFTMDKEVYVLEVDVIRTEKGLMLWWYVAKDSEDHKVENIVFTNTYNIPNKANGGGGANFVPNQGAIKGVQTGPGAKLNKQGNTGITEDKKEGYKELPIEEHNIDLPHKVKKGKAQLSFIPKTGDEQNTALHFVLFVLAGMLFIILSKNKRRNYNKF